jgi:hypothetical protein
MIQCEPVADQKPAHFVTERSDIQQKRKPTSENQQKKKGKSMANFTVNAPKP